MAPRDPAVGSVLIIDRDAADRELIATLLRRQGFRTECRSGDGAGAPPDREFDVIVRELNLAPRTRERSLQELEDMRPELLRRTVIVTTAPAPLLNHSALARPFAVLRKPFEIDELVETVRRCGARPRPSRNREDSPASVDLSRLRRFVSDVPHLREMLDDDTASPKELLLRSELRRVALELSHVLREAAQLERDRTHAAILTGASAAAAELAGPGAAGAMPPAQREH